MTAPTPTSATEKKIEPRLPPYRRFTEFLTRIHAHPIATHTPNGVLPAAFFLYAAGALLGNQVLMLAGHYNLIFVAVAMPAVLYSGYVDWQNRYRGNMTWLFRNKIISGFLVAIISLILAPLPFSVPAFLDPHSGLRFAYLAALGADLGPAIYAGYLGGRLVFPTKKK